MKEAYQRLNGLGTTDGNVERRRRRRRRRKGFKSLSYIPVHSTRQECGPRDHDFLELKRIIRSRQRQLACGIKQYVRVCTFVSLVTSRATTNHFSSCRNHDGGNITRLMLQRERGTLKGRNVSVGQTCGQSSRQMGSWAEKDFMQHCSSRYIDFKPVPRSTIAAAFSPNGRLLASTQ